MSYGQIANNFALLEPRDIFNQLEQVLDIPYFVDVAPHHERVERIFFIRDAYAAQLYAILELREVLDQQRLHRELIIIFIRSFMNRTAKHLYIILYYSLLQNCLRNQLSC